MKSSHRCNKVGVVVIVLTLGVAFWVFYRRPESSPLRTLKVHQYQS